jgi:hypothetical protein
MRTTIATVCTVLLFACSSHGEDPGPEASAPKRFEHKIVVVEKPVLLPNQKSGDFPVLSGFEDWEIVSILESTAKRRIQSGSMDTVEISALIYTIRKERK